MKGISDIIGLIQEGTGVLQLVTSLTSTPVDDEALAISAALLSIIKKAMDAHQKVIGQPIDLSLLHQIEPLG
jgi:hypothetical protein